MLLIKSDTIIDLFQWFAKRKGKKSCGDCVLILFGIREKYELEIYQKNKNILRAQMSYFEQKAHELTLWLILSFQDDMEKLGVGKSPALVLSQSCNYQEALKNAMVCVKDEVRKAFKENGFHELSDQEFTAYVKSKVKTLISIVQSYLTTYYTSADAIVTLKYRFDKIDYNRLTDVGFDVFGNARNVVQEAKLAEEGLKKRLSEDIDSFLEKLEKN